MVPPRLGVLSTKDPTGICLKHTCIGSKISLLHLGILMIPYFMQKWVIWMRSIFKIFPNLSQNWLKFRKCEKYLVIFADLLGKLKMEREKVRKWAEDFFSFFFFFLVTFWNHWNLFGVYQNGQFLPGNSYFMPGKKSGKLTLSPLKNIPLTSLHRRLAEANSFYILYVTHHIKTGHLLVECISRY